MNGPSRGRLVVLDACCLINIAASGSAAELLAALPEPGAVTERVLAEAQHIRGPAPEDPALVRENNPIRIDEWVEQGAIEALRLESDQEFELFVDLACELDDGEAESLAIALARGHVVATDDGKARRVALSRGIPLLSTPEIVRKWSELTRMSPSQTKAVLAQIADRARFRPSAKLPDADWWVRSVSR